MVDRISREVEVKKSIQETLHAIKTIKHPALKRSEDLNVDVNPDKTASQMYDRMYHTHNRG